MATFDLTPLIEGQVEIVQALNKSLLTAVGEDPSGCSYRELSLAQCAAVDKLATLTRIGEER